MKNNFSDNKIPFESKEKRKILYGRDDVGFYYIKEIDCLYIGWDNPSCEVSAIKINNYERDCLGLSDEQIKTLDTKKLTFNAMDVLLCHNYQNDFENSPEMISYKINDCNSKIEKLTEKRDWLQKACTHLSLSCGNFMWAPGHISEGVQCNDCYKNINIEDIPVFRREELTKFFAGGKVYKLQIKHPDSAPQSVVEFLKNNETNEGTAHNDFFGAFETINGITYQTERMVNLEKLNEMKEVLDESGVYYSVI